MNGISSRICLFTLLVSTAANGGIADAAEHIVEGGKANAEIVIAENPPRMTRLAARELQTYVEKISCTVV